MLSMKIPFRKSLVMKLLAMVNLIIYNRLQYSFILCCYNNFKILAKRQLKDKAVLIKFLNLYER